MTDKQEDNDNQVLYLKNESNNTVHCTINYSEINEYLLSIKNDLNQIERLVDDATTNLVTNFKNINELHHSNQTISSNITIHSIPETNTLIQESLQQKAIISKKIEDELKSALISLQFGDLVSQLLVHTTKQVEILNRALQHSGVSQSELNIQSTLKDIPHGLSEALQQAQISRTNKPVEHHEIQTGKIELF